MTNRNYTYIIIGRIVPESDYYDTILYYDHFHGSYAKERKMETNIETRNNANVQERMKFCKHCGEKIPEVAVICIRCGCQVEEMKYGEQPSIVINNANTNSNTNINSNMNPNLLGIRARNKWVSFFLCLFIGYLGAHKFYEGKIGMGVLYLLTAGLFGIGWLIDCILLLLKPNPYYVH